MPISYTDIRKAYEDTYGKSKYNTIYEQIENLSFDDIEIKVDPYPLQNETSFHIIITSKEGYGIHRYVTSSNINMDFPVPDKELQGYINNARYFFNKNKEVTQKIC